MKLSLVPILLIFIVSAFPAHAQHSIDGKGALAEFDKGMAAYSAKNYTVASASFGNACQYGMGVACYNLGQMYWQGTGLVENTQTAIEYFLKACEGRKWLDGKYAYGDGCYFYGLELYNAKRLDKDEIAARAYFIKACELNSGKGCVMAAMNEMQGKGGPVSGQQAYDHAEKGCEADQGMGCYLAGYLLMNERATDPEKPVMRDVIEYYQRACTLGYKDACEQ